MSLTGERKHLEQLSPEELYELVHELKADEAAEINNQGKNAQITYLLGE